MKLKEFIKKWLLSEELHIIDQLKSEYSNCIDVYEKANSTLSNSQVRLREAFLKLNEALYLSDEARKMVGRFLDIGVDLHVDPRNTKYNWAVVCVDGRPEYVKFIPLNNHDARSVLQYLKQFEYSKHTIDSPFAFRDMIKDWTL